MLGEEKSRQHAVGRDFCPYVRHRARASAGQGDAAVLNEQIRVRLAAAHRGYARERHNELFAARIDEERFAADVGRLEAEHRGELVARCGHWTRPRRIGLQRPFVAAGAHGDNAGEHFQRNRVAAPERAHDVRGAERRVAGEGHLERRRENPHAGGRATRR